VFLFGVWAFHELTAKFSILVTVILLVGTWVVLRRLGELMGMGVFLK